MAIDEFLHSCSNADQYPKNLITYTLPEYTIRALENQLDDRTGRLFCPTEEQSTLDFIEQLSPAEGQ